MSKKGWRVVKRAGEIQKVGRKVVLLYFGQNSFEKFLSSFLGFILFEEHTSGERNKETHVHIDGNENEKILSYIKHAIA